VGTLTNRLSCFSWCRVYDAGPLEQRAHDVTVYSCPVTLCCPAVLAPPSPVLAPAALQVLVPPPPLAPLQCSAVPAPLTLPQPPSMSPLSPPPLTTPPSPVPLTRMGSVTTPKSRTAMSSATSPRMPDLVRSMSQDQASSKVLLPAPLAALRSLTPSCCGSLHSCRGQEHGKHTQVISSDRARLWCNRLLGKQT
jgi:hypothetical protein